MQGDGEGQNRPAWRGAGVAVDEEDVATGAVDIGVAGLGDGAENVAPVGGDGRDLLEEVAAGVPVARLPEVGGRGLVDVEPVAAGVEDLDKDIGADRHGNAGVEEIAGVDDYRGTTAAGLKGTEGPQKIFDGAVSLEEVHVLDTAEAALQRGGHDDDR